MATKVITIVPENSPLKSYVPPVTTNSGAGSIPQNSQTYKSGQDLLIDMAKNGSSVSRAGDIINKGGKDTASLSSQLKQLQNEKAMKTQRWENGVYMGVDRQLAADYDKQIASLKDQIDALNKPQEPNTSEARENLLARLNSLNANAGYVSTVEQSDAQDAERRAVLDQLHDEDAALGNNARAYDARERAGEIVRGSTKQIGAGYTNFLGTAFGAMGETAEKLDPNILASIYGGGDIGSARAIESGMTEEATKKGAQDLRKYEANLTQIADKLSSEASRDLSQAKEGLGELGQFGVDVSSNMIQMGADAIGNAAGLGMVPFFVRATGSSMQEARLEGAESSKQFLYGLAKGGVEVATEKLFDGVAGLFGKGAADDVVESVIGKLTKSDTGRTVLRAISGAAGEGTEEVISDLLDPFAKLIYNDQALKEAWENRKDLASDMLYDYLVGAAMGAIGGAGSIATGQNAQKNAALRAAEAETTPNVSQQTTQPDTAPTRRSGEDILMDAVNEARSGAESVETGEAIQMPMEGQGNIPAAQAGGIQSAPNAPISQEAGATAQDGSLRERGYSENIRTDAAMEQEVREAFETDPSLYHQQSNADTLAKAQEIYGKGTYEAARQINDAISKAKAGAKLPVEMIPLSRLVANDLAQQGKVQEARDMLADIAAELTYYGQASQAARILRNSDPATQAIAIERLVDRLNSDLTKGQRRKNKALGRSAEGDIVVNQHLLQQYAQETDSAVKDQLLSEIQQDIADQAPATFKDKFTALRYLNMLGNLKTQVRNVVGNVNMFLTSKVKNRVRAVSEMVASAATGGKYERSTSFFVNPALKKEARADADNVMAELRGENKYSDVGAIANQGIQEKRRIFNSSLLEGYRKATNWAMENKYFGDAAFLRINYTDALAGWMQAHGIKSIADATPEQLSQGRAFAIQEAQEATFRDSNAISDLATNAFRGPKVPKALRVVGEGIAPFRKTPANVAVRAVEYSPVGIAETIYKGIQTIQGKAEASDVINSASKNVTGTALAIAGYLLAAGGGARGTEDDDELSNFQKMQGAMDYSINIGGIHVSLSQLSPTAVPFFMGVEFYEAMKDEIASTDDMQKILGCITDPMLEMSMLGGLNDALSDLSSSGGDADAISKLFINSGISYLSQAITNTLLGQAEQASEEYRQTIYTQPGGVLGSDLQYKLGQLSAKTPGWDYNQQDYIDAWGRRQSSGSAVERILNSFINPTYYSKDRSTEVDAELERLYTENKNIDGFPSVLPQKASRSLEYTKGVNMTPDEYQQYSIDRGQMSLSLVSDFMNSSQYKELSDQQRAEVISNLYSLAADRALKKVKTSNGVNYTGRLDDIAALSSPSDYYSYKQVLEDASSESSTSEDFARVDEMIRRYGLLPNDVQDKLETTSNLNLDGLLFASTKGIGAEQWYDDREAIKGAADEAGGADMAKALAVWNNTSGTTKDRIAAIEAQLKPDAGGKRNATVRRIEAYDSFCQKNNINNPNLSQWLEIMAAFKDYTTSSSISKANARKAWEEKMGKSFTTSYAGLTWNNARVIFNTYYGDDSYANQYDESYAKLNPAKEKEESDIYGWLTGKTKTGSSQTEVVVDTAYLDKMLRDLGVR